jgi:hypothetical protein
MPYLRRQIANGASLEDMKRQTSAVPFKPH